MFVGADYIIANLLIYDDTKNGFDIAVFDQLITDIMAEYKESCIWYFDIGINIVNFYIKAYKDKWAKSQNRIYKTADFNLKYFTSSYPESLNKIVQKLCREVMKNNIIVKKES